MAIVYVTHIPHRKDPATDNFVPTINIAPASEWGEIKVLMPPRAAFHETDYLIKRLDDGLHTYNIANADCLLPLGDPVLIASAVYVLARKGAPFYVLRYDKKLGKYLRIRIGSFGF